MGDISITDGIPQNSKYVTFERRTIDEFGFVLVKKDSNVWSRNLTRIIKEFNHNLFVEHQDE